MRIAFAVLGGAFGAAMVAFFGGGLIGGGPLPALSSAA